MKPILLAVAAILLFGCCRPLPLLSQKNVPVAVIGSYALDTTMKVEVRNLDSTINSTRNEFSPFIQARGKALYFSSTQRNSNIDLYIAVKKKAGDTVWESVSPLASPINSGLQEGSPAISANDSVMVFVSCNRREGEGDCDLYTILNPYTPSPTVANLHWFNTPYWESAPALSSDGRTVYFISNRPEGMGGADDADIYVSTVGKDSAWTEPKRLEFPINTKYREDSPFLAAGDSLLYFASAAPGGIGGRDIYVSSRKSDGTWGTPRNLGRPINTERDEAYFSSTEDGFVHYFCSSRTDILNYRIFDIYMVRLVP